MKYTAAAVRSSSGLWSGASPTRRCMESRPASKQVLLAAARTSTQHRSHLALAERPTAALLQAMQPPARKRYRCTATSLDHRTRTRARERLARPDANEC